MVRPRRRLFTLLAAFSLALAIAGPAQGSSHREAPYTTTDPTADNTDVYAFVSPDDPSKVTLIANFIPLEEPDSAPFYYNFDPAVRYRINVDNNGDAVPDITYEFQFRTAPVTVKVGGYSTGRISSITDTDFNYRQLYSVSKTESGRTTWMGSGLRTPPVNIGPRVTPRYASLAAQGIHGLGGGRKVFAGQREEGFFVDIGSIGDDLGLRPFNGFHIIPLEATQGVDGLSGFNVHTIALQVPITDLTRDHRAHPATDRRATIGVWSTAMRQSVRVLSMDPTKDRWAGPLVQVSRLANPLVNEELMPIAVKDRFNRTDPAHDSQYVPYVLAPEPARLINKLYPALPNIAETNRTDLVAILLTGIPGLNYTGPVKADMMRLNTGLKPNANGACYDPSLGKPANAMPSRLGVLAGDLCGFPNGRRPADDTVDIEIRSIAQGYGPYVHAKLGLPDKSPNDTLGDGVDANDAPFLQHFPYLATPHQGYSHQHVHGLIRE